MITIGHLYPDMLNLYGDAGNIATLQYRLKARRMDVEIKTYSIDDEIDFSVTDIIVLGGGGDRENKAVCESLKKQKDALISYAEDGGVILATCGGYEMLGKHYATSKETVEGVGLLDIYSEYSNDKLIGNIITENNIFGTIVGFENHNSIMNIGNHTPLGKVIHGIGNDGNGAEGVIYKNVIGTYIHGPVLPKNPRMADFIIAKALERKGEDADLVLLDDTIEVVAHNYIIGRFSNK